MILKRLPLSSISGTHCENLYSLYSPSSAHRYCPLSSKYSVNSTFRPAIRLYNGASTNCSNSLDAPQKAPRKYLSRAFNFLAISTFSLVLGVIMAIPAETDQLPTTRQISDAETLELFEPADAEMAKIENHIQTHALVKSLRSNPDYTESRPHLQIPETQRHRNFTAGTLAGHGRIEVPPLIFSERSGKDMVSVSYLGSDVCGYPGLVHGGLLATLLDEGLARCCFPALPNKIGMTANLNINYRSPTPASGYYVLRAATTKVEGRKAWVEGCIESLVNEGENPAVYVEASALFIEPKNAASLRRVFPIKGDNTDK